MNPSTTIRVMLVDDQTLIRQGFSYVIGVQPDMALVGEAADGEEAVKLALAAEPDVILMDVQMPRMTGIQATQAILVQRPQTKIVILTTFNDEAYIYEGIRAGAVGYLLKDADTEDMLATVRAVYRGEAVFRSGLAAHVLTKLATSTAAAVPAQQTVLAEPLTPREKDILQEMAYGLRNDQIAAKLFISEGTVKTHVHHILQKLGAEDRTQAVVYALRNGLAQ
ncbi:response regulator [Paenibacillus ferrarius]|uniref:response regulator n=1 Tax=Paenibacillus ferrarius TaxID=1469647 RepID=UPI003D29524B